MLGHETIEKSYQTDWYSCGAHCAHMVLHHFGVRIRYSTVKAAVKTTPLVGTRLVDIQRFLRSKAFRVGHREYFTLRQLEKVLRRDAVVISPYSWNHVVVVHGVDREHVYITDPRPLTASKVRRSRFSKVWGHCGLVIYPK